MYLYFPLAALRDDDRISKFDKDLPVSDGVVTCEVTHSALPSSCRVGRSMKISNMFCMLLKIKIHLKSRCLNKN